MSIESRYELGPRLWAEGGVEAYVALDTDSGEPVSAFLFPRARTAAPHALTAFQQLGRRLSGLSHPSLLEVLSIGVEDGVGYLIAADIEGTPFARLLERADGPSLGALLETVPGLLEGLALGHAAGFHHGRLGAERVYLSDGQAVVVGLGLSQLERALEFGAYQLDLGNEDHVARDRAAIAALSGALVVSGAPRPSRTPAPATKAPVNAPPIASSVRVSAVPVAAAPMAPAPLAAPSYAATPMAPAPLAAPPYAATPMAPAPLAAPSYVAPVASAPRPAALAYAPAPASPIAPPQARSASPIGVPGPRRASLPRPQQPPRAASLAKAAAPISLAPALATPPRPPAPRTAPPPPLAMPKVQRPPIGAQRFPRDFEDEITGYGQRGIAVPSAPWSLSAQILAICSVTLAMAILILTTA